MRDKIWNQFATVVLWIYQKFSKKTHYCPHCDKEV